MNYRVIDNRKYMWDGMKYESEADALKAAAAYKKDRFDVQLVSASDDTAPDGGKEAGGYLLYTRRVAASAAAPS